MSACAASAAVSAWTLGPRLDAGLVRGAGRLVLNVVDDRVLLSAVVLDGGRLDLAGDVGVSDVVVSDVAGDVVDERVYLGVLSPLRQAVEYLDDLDLRGRSFRRRGRRSRRSAKSSALHWRGSCPCFILHSLSSLLRSLFLDLVLMPGILQPKACLLVTGVGTLLWSFLWCRSNTGEDHLGALPLQRP